MQRIMHTNIILDVENAYMIRCIQFLSVQRLSECDECEHQQSVTDFKSYTFGNQWSALSHPAIINVSVGSIAKKANDSVVCTS
jgi:hypothetical protein